VNDTIRELIISEFVTRAAVIRTTGSPQLYATDCGQKVLRATPKIAPSDLPCVAIWPEPEEAESIHRRVRHSMTITIEGIAKFGADDPSEVAEKILGDLIRCFTARTWERRRPKATSPITYDLPYAESIVYAGGGPESYPEDGVITIGAVARFLVTYYTTIGDPCAQ
jgi:hypothetical protein